MKYQAISAPDWLARSAVYQINPRTFSKEGTISAMTQELPALRKLGFSVMYLCPVFEEDASEDRTCWSERQKKYGTENPKNPYRIKNYFTIDSEYGTMEDLREFITVAHKLGMYVLLDLVYLHIGPDASILKRHPEFAEQDPEGNILMSSWHFPILDYTCYGLREYLWCNMVYFISELDVDGFRCDAGDYVPIDFWNEGRRRIRAVKPDAVLINEGNKWDYLLSAFDSTYYTNWHTCLYGVFSGTTSLDELRQKAIPVDFPAGGLLLRSIDDHDTVTDRPSRTEIVAGHDGMEQIEVINYLMDGIPMVYCGNELADSTNINMFANRFHMGRYEATDRSIAAEPASIRRQELMIKLNTLKGESDILRYGETHWLPNSKDDKVISFCRKLGEQSILFIGNAERENVTATIEADISGSVMFFHNASIENTNNVKLEPYGYLVLH